MNWWDTAWNAFCNWWTTIDWGDAPGWVGAIGTAGALVLGMLILRGDRKIARRAEADSFASWYLLRTDDRGNAFLDVNFHNAGRRPLPVATVHSWSGQVWNRKFAKAHGVGSFAIPPDAAPRVTIALASEFKRSNYYISFTDNQNKNWYRTVRDNEYVSERTVGRWSKRRPSREH